MEKRVFIEFGDKKLKTRSIFFDSHPVEGVDKVKYLGIGLNSQLILKSFENFVNLVVKKLSKLLGLLKFSRQDLNLENRLLYYKTYIEPIIS